MIQEQIFDLLRKSAAKLAGLSAAEKNQALKAVQDSLLKNQKQILEANALDVAAAIEAGTKESLVDRLRLTESRWQNIAGCINTVIAQTDPVGSVESGWITAAGLEIRKVRVPLGVASIIYESRPNVTVDAFSLAFKSGNAILLRGSSSALNSNKAIVAAIKGGLCSYSASSSAAGLENAVFLADSGERSDVDQILNAVGKIDVVLPRGGAALIRMVVEKARVPVIETGSGICHLFVDESADIEMAAEIAENAKLQRPGVCNAIEVCLVHKNAAPAFLPALVKKFADRAELRCDARAMAVLEEAGLAGSRTVTAGDTDFDTEFLDNILAVKTVDSVEEAVEHINAHNTKHSESIITRDRDNARYFQSNVDAACVYVNASTRFTDGEMFGYGAELGISTQKMHVRGPMGLTALTTTKYFIDGNGQVRK